MAKQVYKWYSKVFRIQIVREYEQEDRLLNTLHQRYGVSCETLEKMDSTIQHARIEVQP